MASYYTFARVYSPRIFATLAATTLRWICWQFAGSVPLVWLQSYVARNAVGFGHCQRVDCNCRLHIKARNPPKVESAGWSVYDLLKMPVLWLIIPLVFGTCLLWRCADYGLVHIWLIPMANATQVGNVSMTMSLAIIAEHLPMAHWTVFGSRKWSSLPGM